MDKEVLQGIRDCTDMVRQNSQRMLGVENQLRSDPQTTERIAPLYEMMRQRQRDFAVMIRMMGYVEREFLSGGNWLLVHRRFQEYRKRFDLMYRKLDLVLERMLTRTIRVN